MSLEGVAMFLEGADVPRGRGDITRGQFSSPCRQVHRVGPRVNT